jgi:hypothetical protein
VDAIRARYPDGPSPALEVLLADAVMIGERLVREHEAEASRGWNAMAMLRDLPTLVRTYDANWRAANRRWS